MFSSKKSGGVQRGLATLVALGAFIPAASPGHPELDTSFTDTSGALGVVALQQSSRNTPPSVFTLKEGPDASKLLLDRLSKLEKVDPTVTRTGKFRLHVRGEVHPSIKPFVTERDGYFVLDVGKALTGTPRGVVIGFTMEGCYAETQHVGAFSKLSSQLGKGGVPVLIVTNCNGHARGLAAENPGIHVIGSPQNELPRALVAQRAGQVILVSPDGKLVIPEDGEKATQSLGPKDTKPLTQPVFSLSTRTFDSWKGYFGNQKKVTGEPFPAIPIAVNQPDPSSACNLTPDGCGHGG